MAAQRDPVPNEVFINNLHASSIRIKPESPQRLPDLIPRGPGLVPPDQASPNQGIGGPTCLAMEVTTPAVDAVAIDSDWRAPLLAYLLDEVLPANRTKAQKIA
jgi:hypothetical protein